MLIRIFIISLIFTLIGCSDSNVETHDQKASKNSNSTHEQLDSKRPDKPSIDNRPISNEKRRKVEDTSKITSKKHPIDLTLPDDWDADNQDLYETPIDNLLPNLFQKKPKEKDVKFGGKLLNDESNDNYVDSIEGAEISVEIKLQ